MWLRHLNSQLTVTFEIGPVTKAAGGEVVSRGDLLAYNLQSTFADTMYVLQNKHKKSSRAADID